MVVFKAIVTKLLPTSGLLCEEHDSKHGAFYYV